MPTLGLIGAGHDVVLSISRGPDAEASGSELPPRA